MSNGEVVFEAPWQGRVFGMARVMTESGLFDWTEFRACLIDELSAAGHPRVGEFAYYDHFQRALERLLASKGIVSAEALAVRTRGFAERPPDHDHDHHDHHRHDSRNPGRHHHPDRDDPRGGA
jgi:nitrile hydratase accessory protein